MKRKEYIAKLNGVLEATDSLIAQNGCIEADGLPDNLTDLEKKQRKGINSALDALRDAVFTAGSVSEREMREAHDRGDAEQDELDFRGKGGGAPEVRDDAAAEAPLVKGKGAKKSGKKGAK